MSGMGPPPNPNARRRNARPTGVELPAEGRVGDAPDWPLDECTSREADIWSTVWRTPQAAAWERLAWTLDVALYVRFMALAETGDLNAAKEARQWSDRLGLSPLAMLRLQWRIVQNDIAERPKATRKGRRAIVRVVASESDADTA